MAIKIQVKEIKNAGGCSFSHQVTVCLAATLHGDE